MEITKGYVVVKTCMNPHRTDDMCMYNKLVAFLPDENSMKEYKKTHSDYSGICELGKYWPSIDLD